MTYKLFVFLIKRKKQPISRGLDAHGRQSEPEVLVIYLQFIPDALHIPQRGGGISGRCSPVHQNIRRDQVYIEAGKQAWR